MTRATSTSRPTASGGSWHRFANPGRFLRISGLVYPWSLGLALLCLGVGLVWSLGIAPADYQQGESVRIMYVHVPAAWMALFAYSLLAAAGASLLIWRHPLGGIAATAIAPVGATFTFLALVTGSLWGKPMWGTWWVWDARLTSVLILLFLYLGHMALTHAFENAERGRKAAAVLALAGVVNLPIIKFSVDWWNTLHQPASVTRIGTPAIHEAMLWPLLVMAGGFMFFFFAVVLLRMRAALVAQRAEALDRRIMLGR
ncbi:heme ABC transporter permease [Fodinicurvata sediminis]|uniref:heme ABC transporter permease n=1 Tax=Fodinicurvata sediminis TaxID=1121832 RepID=UPI0003B5E876|nr:heme ABC transporter permease [Fodinicurvata sediminis]